MDNIPPMLTNREQEILLALSEGASNQDIANRISLSVYTVKDHLKNIYAKLNVTSRTQALAVARDIGLLGEVSTPHPQSVHHLPQLSQPLFGRDEELELVMGLLSQPHARLITLHGPGGIGKTHLALAVAHQVLDRFPDGVFMVQLSQVGNTDGLMPAILATLDIEGDPAMTPIAQVIAAVGRRRTLIVLDNMEHLFDVTPLIVRLLNQTSQLRLLVTSRLTLNVPAEHVIRLWGLNSSPDGSAKQLFIFNAKRLQHTYQPTPADVDLIHDICRWVGGMPLAVLLASAWMARLPLAAIHRGLQTNFHQLDRPMTDMLSQERSLKQIFDTTWALLNTAEQNMLLDAAVFADEISYQALEQVATIDHDALESLINQSLIIWSPATQRYQLHPVFKQFTHQRLAQSGRLADTQARLYEFLIGTLEAPSLSSHTWMLDIHQHDIVALLEAAIQGQDAERAFRLWRGIGRLWKSQGRPHELKHLFDRLHDLFEQNLPDNELGEIYELAARRLHGIMDHVDIQRLIEAAVYHFHKAGNVDGEIAARDFLSYILSHQGKVDEAHAIQHENLVQSRANHNPDKILLSLTGLGITASQIPRYEDAIAYYTEALELARAERSIYESHVVMNLGVVYLKMGRYDQAHAYFNSAILLFEQTDQQHMVCLAWANLGEVAFKQGDYAEAEQYHRMALQDLVKRDYTLGIIHQLEAFGFLYGVQDKPAHGVQLLAAAAILRQRMSNVRTPREQLDYEQDLERIRAKLTPEIFDAAWQLGSSLPLVTILDDLLGQHEQ